MQKQIFGSILLLAVLSTEAWGASVPRHAVPLEKYSSGMRISEDATRLRISVATDSAQGERSVRVGDVLLCKADDCFRAHTTGFVDVGNTSAGTANVVVDVVIPAVTITDVYFTETGGRTRIAGHLKLVSPIVIEKGFHGLELLIGVRKQQAAAQTVYVPTQSANSYFNLESELVHYLPSVQTVAKLSLGTVLTIPAGASIKPHVFHISIDDRGEIYPRIDIYPNVKLNKPAIVETPTIPGGSSTHDMIVPVGAPEEKHLWATPNSKVPTKNGRVSLDTTGPIEPSAFEDSASDSVKATPGTSSAGPSASAATAKSCAQTLASPIVLGMLQMATAQTGAVYMKACENIKPNIHILYINTQDKRIRYSIPYKPSKVQNGNGPNLILDRINAFTTLPSIGLINGSSWDGQEGMSSGESGKAEGIVRSNGTVLGNNIEGGGRLCKGCVVASNKFIMAYAPDKTRPVFFTTSVSADIPNFATNVVSSSTSIIKNGVCASPGGQNRWSAVGASNGRMVFISSTSGGQTSAAELCAVFKALAINNALRLDGGPSAAIVVGGKQLNKLEGLARVKYGYARHIAYPLRISN